ncbi:MAG: GntR family transcriptional regulator [Oscillospiraceae bacterium]|nr:GntR family transcriptional regulator [Oscillospiraceae bacterium]
MININFRDTRPIYEQIKDGLRRLILSGALPADSKIPSVREMASDLAINPSTIQRAYRELEAEGYICSVPGKGSFVAARSEADSLRITELLGKFDELVTELSYIGVTGSMLIDRLKGEQHHD